MWSWLFPRKSRPPEMPVEIQADAVTHPALSPQGYWKEPVAPPRLVVLSGAGLSAESGLSTFRDADGLWQRYDCQQVCHASDWRAHRTSTHDFHDALRARARSASPNRAHAALARLNSPQVVLATQNVDGLLERSGARDVLNLHGRLDRLHCVACARQWAVPWSFQAAGQLPRCPWCPPDSPALVKPGVVFFHEPAPLYPPLRHLLGGLTERDTVAVVGTSGTVLNLVSWLAHVPAQKWLLNLAAEPAIPAKLFDQALYGPATETVPEFVERWERSLS